MNVQLQKIIRDLWLYRLRSGLSIFTICVGLVFFGAMSTARDVLRTSYEQSFRMSNPAQVMMQISPFESNLLRRIDMIDGVAASDARFIATNLRINVAADEWIPLVLYASDDYANLNLHRIFGEPGTVGYVPPPDTIWLDRSILQRNQLAQGNMVTIQNAEGELHPLQVSGFVNDVIAFPTHLSDQATAFVSFETLQNLKLALYVQPGQPAFNQLYLRFNAVTDNVIAIRGFVSDVQNEIKNTGYQLLATEYLSDAPPLESQTSVMDTLLIYSTILTFCVTGVLIGNFTSAIVGRQISEIGIMKSLGAVPSQIIRLFFLMMIIMGLIAFFISLPLTGYVAKAFSQFLVDLIDIDMIPVVVSLQTRLLQFVAALLIPLVAALIPIIHGARLSVRDTLRSEGARKNSALSWFSLPQTIIPMIVPQMGMRNIFLKPGRFLLTTIALTLPGGLFIASFGIEAALIDIDSRLGDSLYNYDIDLTFDGYQPVPLLERIAYKQEGVMYVEAWRQGNIYRVYDPASRPPVVPADDDTSQPIVAGDEQPALSPPPRPDGGQPPPRANGNRPPPPPNGANRPPPGDRPPARRLPPNPLSNEPSISGEISLRGIPINSRIVRFTADELTQGNWLQTPDDILLTYEAYEAISLDVDRSPAVVLGASNSDDQVFNVAGVTGQLIIESFIDIHTFERFIPNWASSIRLAIVTNSHDTETVDRVLENLRHAYNDEGIAVNASVSVRELVERREERLGIVTQTLITLAIIVGIVSVIGLISTLSINIRERTKSIGILRSLGGDYRHLGMMVLIESLTILLISYVLAFPVSYVIGHGISSILGEQMYSLTAYYTLQPFGVVVWFVVMVLVGIVATLGPALYAMNITISDTLRYEG